MMLSIQTDTSLSFRFMIPAGHQDEGENIDTILNKEIQVMLNVLIISY